MQTVHVRFELHNLAIHLYAQPTENTIVTNPVCNFRGNTEKKFLIGVFAPTRTLKGTNSAAMPRLALSQNGINFYVALGNFKQQLLCTKSFIGPV